MEAIARWVWSAESRRTRIVRGTLAPLEHTYGWFMRTRAAAYRTGLLPSYSLGLPTVAVGGLTVGGAGKTPVASWIAAHFVARGLRPGILSRGYGGDEDAVHRRLVPRAIVRSAPDRRLAARDANALGADVLVLDDAFQRLSVRRDLNFCLLSAEQVWSGSPRMLPAGPWREGLAATARADVVVVTNRSLDDDRLTLVRERLAESAVGPVVTARLRLESFRPLWGGPRTSLSDLDGATVLMSAGIASPEALEAQLLLLGARVTSVRWRDHHRYTPGDVDSLLQKSRGVDYVVITEKDAAKLRELWPPDGRQPLVAALAVHWGQDFDRVVSALDALLAT